MGVANGRPSQPFRKVISRYCCSLCDGHGKTTIERSEAFSSSVSWFLHSHCGHRPVVLPSILSQSQTSQRSEKRASQTSNTLLQLKACSFLSCIVFGHTSSFPAFRAKRLRRSCEHCARLFADQLHLDFESLTSLRRST